MRVRVDDKNKNDDDCSLKFIQVKPSQESLTPKLSQVTLFSVKSSCKLSKQRLECTSLGGATCAKSA